jgi:hypothetical protein
MKLTGPVAPWLRFLLNSAVTELFLPCFSVWRVRASPISSVGWRVPLPELRSANNDRVKTKNERATELGPKRGDVRQTRAIGKTLGFVSHHTPTRTSHRQPNSKIIINPTSNSLFCVRARSSSLCARPFLDTTSQHYHGARAATRTNWPIRAGPSLGDWSVRKGPQQSASWGHDTSLLAMTI